MIATTRRRIEYLLCFLFLTIGGVIYLLYRPRILMLHVIADGLGLGGCIDSLRGVADQWPLPSFLVFCVPNGLWSTAYILLIDGLIAGRSRRWQRLVGVSVIPFLGAMSELLQASGTIPGTFDWGDLLCYLLPLLVYAMVASNKQEKRQLYAIGESAKKDYQ